jgi:hypothetical protein
MREPSPKIRFKLKILFFLTFLFCWFNYCFYDFYHSKRRSTNKIQKLKSVKSTSPISDFIRNLRLRMLCFFGIIENGEDEFEKNNFFFGNVLPQLTEKDYKGVYTEKHIDLFLSIPSKETKNKNNENENTGVKSDNDEYMIQNDQYDREKKSKSDSKRDSKSDTESEYKSDNKTVNYKKVYLADLMSKINEIKKNLNLPDDYFQKIALNSLNSNSDNNTRNIYFQDEKIKNSKTNFNTNINSQINKFNNYNYNNDNNNIVFYKNKINNKDYEKPSLLCCTFCSLSEDSIPEILAKVFAFNTIENAQNIDINTEIKMKNNLKKNLKNDNIKEIKNKNENENLNLNKNSEKNKNEKSFCDWFVIIYGGDRKLLNKLKQKIHDIETKNNLSHYRNAYNSGTSKSTENEEFRYKGKVVRIIFADRSFLRKLMIEEKKKYFERVEIIEENLFKKSNIRTNLSGLRHDYYGEDSDNINSNNKNNKNDNNNSNNDNKNSKNADNNNNNNNLINSLTISKLSLLLPLLKNNNKYFDIKSYSNLWLIDGDIHLNNFDLDEYLRVRYSAIFSNPPIHSYFPDFSYSSQFFSSEKNHFQNNENKPITVSKNGEGNSYFSPIITQPLIYENTQSYKYLNYEYWSNEDTLLNHKNSKNNNNNKNDINNIDKYDDNNINNKKYNINKIELNTKRNVIAAESRFIEIQAPMVEIRFFIWFFDFFIVPLLESSEILGTDWGLDSLFCRAAKFYRIQEIINGDFHSNTDKVDQNNNNNNNNNHNNNNNNNDDVVCAVLTSVTPVSHRDTKAFDTHLGKLNKKVLGHEFIEKIKQTFPLFYSDGHKQKYNFYGKKTSLRLAFKPDTVNI